MLSILAGLVLGAWLALTIDGMVVRADLKVGLRLVMPFGDTPLIFPNAGTTLIQVRVNNYGATEERITEYRGEVYRRRWLGLRRAGFQFDSIASSEMGLPPASPTREQTLQLRRYPHDDETTHLVSGDKVRIRVTAIFGHESRTASAELDAVIEDPLGARP